VKQRLGNPGKGERGQMAIFIALIFQVLFVLFAMAINVALVIHDKINLQNAVDIAAYYAAQRQAELLNVIAHENYMIRQSYKLLSWRYRALGAAGAAGHPWRSGGGTEVEYGLEPAVCVVHAYNWRDTDPKQELCRDPNVRIPPLPIVPIISPLPFNAIFTAFSIQMRAQAARNCEALGGYNWWYSRNRKQMIRGLAQGLSGGAGGDFTDLNGNSVKNGAGQTFSKNLTYSNQQSIVSFDMMNSLQGVPREKWLSEVLIQPSILYVDPSSSGGGCNGSAQSVSQLPREGFGEAAPVAQPLVPWSQSNFLVNNDYQFSLGVEKNPWVMAYVGIQAQTAPRQVFFPFGDAVMLRARAFAKPFGGRIGPWYGSRWPRNGTQSGGEETDPLVPERLGPNGDLVASANNRRRLPNYSRFPGDTLGMRSRLALAAIPMAFNEASSYGVFTNIWLAMGPQNQMNDPLAYVANSGVVPTRGVRYAELAAISPDLFDVTYYSIEPHFADNYLPRLKANAQKLGIPNTVVVRGDLGQNGQLQTTRFSVFDQMFANKVMQPPLAAPLVRPDAFWVMRDKAALLTAWATGEFLYDYNTFPVERFGQCAITDDTFPVQFRVPSGCAARGGRSGYSVKLISRDYLFAPAHPIGGNGEAPGPILNPPPDGW
jgi:hypothetical protein